MPTTFEDLDYDDVPEDAPDHIKMAVDLERYMEEREVEEYTDEVMEMEDNLVEAANQQKFATDPLVAIAAAYRAVTGERYETVAGKFGLVYDGIDHSEMDRSMRDLPEEELPKKEFPEKERVMRAYHHLGFDEEEMFDVPAHRKKQVEVVNLGETFYLHRSGDGEESTLKDLAHSLHRELEPEMQRDEVADIYQELQEEAARDGKISL